MKGTRFVIVAVAAPDVDRALAAVDGGLEAEITHDYDHDPELGPDRGTVKYSVFYGPETDDASYAFQLDAQIKTNLDATGIPFTMKGSGVVAADYTGWPLYRVHNAAGQHIATLPALDDAAFEALYAQAAHVLPPRDEVTVTIDPPAL